MKLLSFHLIKDYFCPVHRRRLQLENGCESIEKCFLVQYQIKFLPMVRLSHTICTSGYLRSLACTLCLGIANANLLLTKFTLNLCLSMAVLKLWIIIMTGKVLQYQMKFLPMVRLSHTMCTSRYLRSLACKLCLGIACANLLLTKFTLNLGLSMAELELWIIIMIEKFLQYQIKYLPMAKLSHAMCTSRYLLWSPACTLCLGIAGANFLLTKFTLNLGLSMAELELWIIIIITLGPANSIKL